MWGGKSGPQPSGCVNFAGRIDQVFLFCENSTEGNKDQTDVTGVSPLLLITIGPKSCAPHGQDRMGDFVGKGIPGNSGVLSPGPCRAGTVAQDGLASFLAAGQGLSPLAVRLFPEFIQLSPLVFWKPS